VKRNRSRSTSAAQAPDVDAPPEPDEALASDRDDDDAPMPIAREGLAVVAWVLLVMFSCLCYAAGVVGLVVIWESISSDHSVSEAFFGVGMVAVFLVLYALSRHLRGRLSAGPRRRHRRRSGRGGGTGHAD